MRPITLSLVMSSAHLLVCFYAAWALLRGARTLERRQLGIFFILFGTYSGCIGAGDIVPPGWPSRLLVLLGDVMAMEGLLRLHFLALQHVKGSAHAKPPLWSRALVVIAVGLAGGIMIAWRRFGLIGVLALGFLLLAFLVLVFSAFGRATLSWEDRERPFFSRLLRPVTREGRAPRDFMLACLWPLAPAVVYFPVVAGAPISVGAYETLRALSVFAFALALVVAILDHSREPMSLELRFSMATLTIALAAVVLATGTAYSLVGPSVQPALAGRLLALVVVTSLFVVLAFPVVYRRTIIQPVDRLVRGIADVEKGSFDVRLDVERDDEIGSLTGSFNRMVASLREANEELRRQIAARSHELAEALEGQRKAMEIGAVIDDRYLIRRVVGGGGMGVVYAAERLRDKRTLALKIMVGSTAREDAARFAREAEIAAQLHHPNLVSVLDVGVWEGNPYLVMELVDGGALEGQRKRFGDVEWAIPLIGQIAHGLAALHRGGIVHRDLKPANVLLGTEPDGSVEAKITDFGIARQTDDVVSMVRTIGVDAETMRASITRTGAIMGTLPYMAPELARGAKNATTASDVFALGLVAYEMLTGKLPFDLPPLMIAMSGKPLPSIPTLPTRVPTALASQIASCLRTDPIERPSAGDVARLV